MIGEIILFTQITNTRCLYKLAGIVFKFNQVIND